MTMTIRGHNQMQQAAPTEPVRVKEAARGTPAPAPPPESPRGGLAGVAPPPLCEAKLCSRCRASAFTFSYASSCRRTANQAQWDIRPSLELAESVYTSSARSAEPLHASSGQVQSSREAAGCAMFSMAPPGIGRCIQ